VESVSQAEAQKTFKVGQKNVYEILLSALEDLFDEDFDSLEMQKINIEAMEESIADSKLLSFLADSNSLLTYPVMEKAEIQIMDQQIMDQGINQHPLQLPKAEL